MCLCSGLSVLPGNPAVWAISVLFLFHYFKHSEMFQAQNELQGWLLKAEGETHSWAVCDSVTLQPETSALTVLLSDICWDIRRGRKEKWQKEVQGESVLSLFLLETNKKKPEKWDIFSLLKNLPSLLVFNLSSIRKVKTYLNCFSFWKCKDICVTGCIEQTEMNLHQTDIFFSSCL